MTQTRGDAGVGAEARERTMRQVGTAVFWGLALSGLGDLLGVALIVEGLPLEDGLLTLTGTFLAGVLVLASGLVAGILVWLAGVAARAALDRP